MAWGRADRTGQKPEPIAQARCDLLHGQHAHPCGGELDRQRYSVELPADPRYHGTGVVAESKVRPDLARTVHEQPNRLGLAKRRDRPAFGLGPGKRKRWHAPGCLPGQAQWRAARREDRDAWAGVEKGRGDRRDLLEYVLAIVEQQQRLAPSQVCGCHLHLRQADRCAQTHRAEQGLRYTYRVTEWSEVEPRRSVLEALPRTRRELQSQPCLAGPAGSGERQQPRLCELLRKLAQLCVAPHKARRRTREVAREHVE